MDLVHHPLDVREFFIGLQRVKRTGPFAHPCIVDIDIRPSMVRQTLIHHGFRRGDHFVRIDEMGPAVPSVPSDWRGERDGIADAGIAVFLERKRPSEHQSQEWMTRQLGKVESGIAGAARELGERKFCHGDSYTLGDISLACSLLWVEYRLPEIKWRENYPNLRAWIERVEVRQEFIDTKPPGA